MKKKRYLFLALAALALFFSGLAWADGDVNETDDIENATLNEAAAFATSHGAEVRLLQLSKAVTKNILWGEAIIAEVKAKNATADTATAEAILAELEALKEQVGETTPKAGEEGAQEFIDLKHDAINLTKEFRDEIRQLLKAQDVQGLKRKLGQRYWNETRELEEKIKQVRNRYNAEIVEEILGAANITNTALVEKVMNGNASAKEVKDALKDACKNLNPARKKVASLALKEKAAKRNVFVRAVADKVAYRIMERTEARIENRLEKAEKLNLPEKVRERLRDRTQIIEKRMERIENRTQARIEKMEDAQEKETGRLQEKAGRN